MTTIDPSQRLASLLRTQVSAFRDRAATKTAANREAGGKIGTTDALAGLVAQRIHAIDPDDPHRRQKAFRIFLETVLLRELGGDLVQDPAFPHLVDAVQQQMEADDRLAAAAQELTAALLSATPPK